MILYEDMKTVYTMKPTEHFLLHSIYVLSHLMCACKHLSSIYYWTQLSCWWIYHFKKNRFNAINHH